MPVVILDKETLIKIYATKFLLLFKLIHAKIPNICGMNSIIYALSTEEKVGEKHI